MLLKKLVIFLLSIRQRNINKDHKYSNEPWGQIIWGNIFYYFKKLNLKLQIMINIYKNDLL